jgi:serine O-acetyltransferase
MAQLELVTPEATSVWRSLRAEASQVAAEEPSLASLLYAAILSHDLLVDALAFQLARKLGDGEINAMTVRSICWEAFYGDPDAMRKVEADLQAVMERDPACKGYLQPFLYFKGFQALQTHRVAHWLWNQGRQTLAFHFQSRMSELFQVDIHPAARFGSGVFFDHGTGIVVGETAVVGDDVSMLHAVTLGGTGAQRGDRHPKIGKGVLLGAGAKVLGAIEIGEYAKIASGSVVLRPVPAHCTAAGVPARLVGCPAGAEPARTMDHTLADVVYDYAI